MNTKGFTLVELIVVIGIVGILVIGLVAFLSGNTKNAQNQAVENQMDILEQQVKAFKNVHGTYPHNIQVGNSNLNG